MLSADTNTLQTETATHASAPGFCEWTLRCSESQVEPLSDALTQLGASSVSMSDVDANSQAERGLFGEPGMPTPATAWASTQITALFANEADASVARLALAEHLQDAGITDLGLAELADTDWVRLTQSQFEPIDLDHGLWVVPTWCDVPASAQTIVRLDPGLAFGTGGHPTTAMCLRWLAHRCDKIASGQPKPTPALRVLDYGCGSGVLAIAALLLARTHGLRMQAEGVDIDDAAIVASQANAALNGVHLNCHALPEQSDAYDWVLANILATPLKLLAPLLCSRVLPGGHLVLSGILERQTQELIDAFAPWIALDVGHSMDGWVLLTGQKALRA